jgi:hypothetical protein
MLVAEDRFTRIVDKPPPEYSRMVIRGTATSTLADVRTNVSIVAVMLSGQPKHPSAVARYRNQPGASALVI